ncbi:MAG: DNA mismatch repair protein MutT [Phycisphaeraceae bacterium]|nr:MAG: DNA mismatch repair protein MutT [Phycisphaeraceae bacterium]
MGDSKRIEFIARGVHTRGGTVLLCRNVKHGYYYLPGGHVEFGEAAAVSLAREFEEEAGVVAQIGGLLLATEQVFDDGKRVHHEFNLVFHVEHLADADGTPSGEIQSREDEIAFEYVELAAVQELDVRPAEVRAWLAAGGLGEKVAGWISGAPGQG